ncbi:MAG: alpha/beta hydrolase [Syntrophobacterales bacterium]|jgi:hypothetical protein
MKRFFSLFAIACIISLFVGCSSSTSKKSLGYKHYVGPDRVLVLLLPPMGGKGSHYETHGFVEAVREKGFEADLKILDVKPIYYFQGRIIELVKNELVDPAKASGYERLILVGTSLGGHGALLYINQYPEDVDGVVLLAPFLGWSRVADAVEKAGGLKKWEDCPALEWDYACEMWKLLKDCVSDPQRPGTIILGYGTEDGFAQHNSILAKELPPRNVFKVTGGHDWVTWKRLWIEVLEYFHINCSQTGEETCLIEIKTVTD